MNTFIMHIPVSHLALIAPPYERFQMIHTDWLPPTLPPRGLAVIWWLVDGEQQQREFEWVHDRPQGLPLFVVLPPATELARAMPLLAHVNALHPRGVLPSAPIVAPSYLRRLLALPPRDLAGTVTQYLTHRGLLTYDRVRDEVEQTFRSVPEITSISKIARRLYTSRRTLGRHFAAAGLPVPSHWLQFARLLYVSTRLQSESSTASRIAARVGYPDGFTMSNQMKRLIGFRPTDVRSLLGWEWVVESWIQREAATGGFDCDKYADVLRSYCPGNIAD